MNSTFIMLCGLPASGKSTYAKTLLKEHEGAVILSSDEIRETVLGDVNDQTQNSKVFEIMGKETISNLKDGKTVIYDATNISRKKRAGFLRQLPKDAHKEIHYCHVRFDEAFRSNTERERSVPNHVIDRMIRSFQMPVFGEGWDEMVYVEKNQNIDAVATGGWLLSMISMNDAHKEAHNIMKGLKWGHPEFKAIYDLPQDSKYHSFSVSRHSELVFEEIAQNHKEDTPLVIASLMHDIGKAYTKKFEDSKRQPSRYAHYYGHEYAGSMLAFQVLKDMGIEDMYLIYEVTTLVQFHMSMYNKSEKYQANVKKLLGDKMYERLEALNKADMGAK